MQESEMWQAVLRRDTECDGRFVYAVRSTRIYCRPSCPARRPQRENVRFFALPADAEQAGYRACRRCRADQAMGDEPHLPLMERICQYLAEPHERPPTLQELARRFNLSPYHLQRTFKRIVGVTPRQYAAARRLERFKEHLHNGRTVTDALYDAGYPSSSSVYGSRTEALGMTPARYRRGGSEARIAYTISPCPLGWLLVAATGKGVCAVKLGDRQEVLEDLLRREFPEATVERDDAQLGEWVSVILGYLKGTEPHLRLPLDIQATAFQRRVWEALQAIPYGDTRSYGQVAAAIGQPGAARAVGRACATNPVALLIPCHRVVREDGGLGGYHWGLARKQALLEQESQRASGLDQAAEG